MRPVEGLVWVQFDSNGLHEMVAGLIKYVFKILESIEAGKLNQNDKLNMMDLTFYSFTMEQIVTQPNLVSSKRCTVQEERCDLQ